MGLDSHPWGRGEESMAVAESGGKQQAHFKKTRRSIGQEGPHQKKDSRKSKKIAAQPSRSRSQNQEQGENLLRSLPPAKPRFIEPMKPRLVDAPPPGSWL